MYKRGGRPVHSGGILREDFSAVGHERLECLQALVADVVGAITTVEGHEGFSKAGRVDLTVCVGWC